ncbi:MAG TPA: glycosyl hydrolase 108 family protein [Allosphingosinicella sp.]|nr:glycosyl hydrolase 108 family protein [Allosphingosinicella sp.]
MLRSPLDFVEPVEPEVFRLGTPEPETGFADTVQASWDEMFLARNSNARHMRLKEAYDPILDVLNEGRPFGDRFVNPAMIAEDRLSDWLRPRLSFSARGRMSRDQMAAAIHAEIRRRRAADPKFLAEVPDTPDEYLAQVEKRDAAALADARDIQARAGGWGHVGMFVGGAAGSFGDPLNVMTLPLGGWGRTLAGRVGSEAGVSMAIEGASQPFAAENYGDLGADYTLADQAMSVLFAGTAAGGFRAGIELAPRAIGKAAQSAGEDYDRIVSTLFAATPEPIRRRWAEAGTLDGRAAAEAFRAAVPDEYRTPIERAALNVADRHAEVIEASPFEPGFAGDAAHIAKLEEALARLTGQPISPRAAALAGTAAPGPLPATAVPRGTSLSQDDLIRFVINDLEGGAQVVNYSWADGGTTKWGIAAKFNPGVDVASLTEAQAIAISKRNYWFPELDGQPAGVAAVGFDAGFIGGRKVGKRIVGEAGGDVGRALGLYRAHLNRIADTVPGKAKYRKGWNKRVDRLAARIGAAGAEGAFVRGDLGAPRLRRDAFPEGQRDSETEAVLARDWGPRIDDIDDWSETVARLRGDKTGWSPDALYHPDLGDIAVPWGRGGDDGFGLAHIDAKHPDMIDDLPDRLLAMDVRPDRRAGYVYLENPGEAAVVRLDWDREQKTWLLTAFDKREGGAPPAPEVGRGAGGGRDGSPGLGDEADIGEAAADVKARRLIPDTWIFDPADEELMERVRSINAAAAADIDGMLAVEPAARAENLIEQWRSMSGADDAAVQAAWRIAAAIAAVGGRPRIDRVEVAEAISYAHGGLTAAVKPAPDTADPSALARFDDPAGDGAKQQAESLDHDLRPPAAAEAAPGAKGTGGGAVEPEARGGDPAAVSRPIRAFGIPAKAGKVLATFAGDRRAYEKVEVHPRYAEAKTGDEDAALELVRDLVTPENVDAALVRFVGAGDVVLAPVVKKGDAGLNKLPLALAVHYGRATGIAVDTGIVQAPGPRRRGLKGPARIAHRPEFNGAVVPKRRYVLVDDVVTQGGTVAEMADHIRAQGGEVAGVIALASGARSGSLAPTRKMVETIDRRIGDVVRTRLGREPSALTFDEAYYLQSFDPGRLNAHLDAGGSGGGSGADAGAARRGGGGEGRGGRVREALAGFDPAPEPTYRLAEDGGEEPLAAIFDEIDAEEAFAATLRGCL